MSDLAADVVIVGFGGAGAVAAIEAHDAGASVLILEMADEGGGSTRESGGSLRLIADRAKAVAHYHALTQDTTPRSMMEVFVDGAVEIPDWIERQGGSTAKNPYTEQGWIIPHPAPTTAFPHIAGAEGIGARLRVKASDGEAGGEALWKVLHEGVASRNVPIHYRARAKRLVRNTEGRITGLIVSMSEGERFVRAGRAVVLTCGGFNYDAEMQRQFIGVELPSLSPPGRSTGDGVRMAADVGADLWHMNAVAAGFGYRIPGFDLAISAKVSGKSAIIVDQKGHRFIDETAVEVHTGFLALGPIDPIAGLRQRTPSYLIFDEATRKTAPIVSTRRSPYNKAFEWSDDNGKEVAKGWIKKADSLRDLALILGLPSDPLDATVADFNRDCESGTDKLGRDPGLMRPLDAPPYYGISLWPALLNTQGGPRRNEKSQVMDVFGSPIPGLYAAGELGSIWGALYPGAGNVTECIVYGRIAGRNAAAERGPDAG